MEILQDIQSYWNARAAGFSSASLEELDTESGQRWHSIFKNFLPKSPAKVLDCGAGAGFFAVLLRELGYDVTAVDFSPEMLQKAETNLKARGLSATLLQMDAQKLTFPDYSFNAVVSRNLIWNLEAPEKTYSEFCRVLKPGGILIIEDGNHYLHLHDEAYAELKKKSDNFSSKSDLHAKHNADNVDFTVMEKISSHLPLSGIRRPQWDFEQLTRCAFHRVQTEMTFAKTEAGHLLPTRFLICAEK